MPLLGSVLTHLILAVTLVLAAAVAGLMAYHYAKARLREKRGFAYDPETEETVPVDAVEQRAKSAEEIAQIRARIEALMEQQHIRSETQSQHLAQKLDEIRTHMSTQDRKMDGLKSELRHEIRRRDGELDDLRQQLASALDAFWKSMPALPEGAATALALPPGTEAPPTAPAPPPPSYEPLLSEEDIAAEAFASAPPEAPPPAFEDPRADHAGAFAYEDEQSWQTPSEPAATPVAWSSPFEEIPLDDVPHDDASFSEASSDEAPGTPSHDDVPLEDVPLEDASLGSVSLEDASFEEAPAEEAPAEPPPPSRPAAPTPAPPSWSPSLASGDGSSTHPPSAPASAGRDEAAQAAPPPPFAPMDEAFAPPPAAPAPPAPPAPPSPPVQGDDLTAITGVTPEIQRQLYAAGVTTLDEMARWSRADARRISGLVGVPEEVIMHQWIFEAQSVLFEQYQSMMTQGA